MDDSPLLIITMINRRHLLLSCLAGAAASPLAALAFGEDASFQTSDGVHLHVRVAGRGVPCLYLHGGPGSGSHWLEAFSSALLEERFQMIYLDQRGSGRSTSPANGDYSMSRMVEDFEELRRHLGIKRWLTLGHSFGGLLQMGYVSARPVSHSGMLMICCTLDFNESLRSSWIPKACELLGIEDYQPYVDGASKADEIMARIQASGLYWKMGFASRDGEERLRATYAALPSVNWDLSGQAMKFPEYRRSYKPLAHDVQVPVLVFHGRQDWMVGPRHHLDIKFPRVLDWESAAGHMPFLDDADGLAKALDAFKDRFGV